MTQLLFKAHQDAGLSSAFNSVIDLYFISSPPVDVSCIHTSCHCPLSVVNSSLLGIVICCLSITSAFLKAFDLGTLLHDHITQSPQDHRGIKRMKGGYGQVKKECCFWYWSADRYSICQHSPSSHWLQEVGCWLYVFRSYGSEAGRIFILMHAIVHMVRIFCHVAAPSFCVPV